MANFNTYRCDRNGNGGGTAVFVRRSIDHCREEVCSGQHRFEANSVVISMAHGERLKICAVYNSLNRVLDDALLDLVLASDIPMIAAGDFNAKHLAWNSRATNRNGRVLLKYATQHALGVYGPAEPTYYDRNGRRPDVLIMKITSSVFFLKSLFIDYKLRYTE